VLEILYGGVLKTKINPEEGGDPQNKNPRFRFLWKYRNLKNI